MGTRPHLLQHTHQDFPHHLLPVQDLLNCHLHLETHPNSLRGSGGGCTNGHCPWGLKRRAYTFLDRVAPWDAGLEGQWGGGGRWIRARVTGGLRGRLFPWSINFCKCGQLSGHSCQGDESVALTGIEFEGEEFPSLDDRWHKRGSGSVHLGGRSDH